MTDGASFLPRIESVFYAVFDSTQGPKIVHQVPEGLIAVQPSSTGSSSSANPASPASSSSQFSLDESTANLRSGSSVLSSPAMQRLDSRSLMPSPQKNIFSSGRTLFNFDDVSKYIIPHSALCGRLVKYATKSHRIVGFPVELRGRYERNYFRYNLCFVFDRNADLSCYEPVVRKVSRVLTTCEEESAFLSSPQNSAAIYAILEQLYEDLNSYSETSIQIDQFNSIELKIFPFYPNPPPVKDWMVPLALINLNRRIESNWDLTVAKICRYIDGTNHVARIAYLADCDIDLTRQAVSHLLYYQVIMMIDIFQYSNMYTLRKSIQWLAEEPHVKEECGPYITKPGSATPDWPKLLHLYSRLKPGITVLEWMEEFHVEELGIDVRRFTSFGVVKGFLMRVHRWPVFIQDREAPNYNTKVRPGGSTPRPELDLAKIRGRLQEAQPAIASAGAEPVSAKDSPYTTSQTLRRASLVVGPQDQTDGGKRAGESFMRRTRSQRSDSTATATTEYMRRSYNTYLGPNSSGYSPPGTAYKISPDIANLVDFDSEHSSGGRSTLGVVRPRLSRSPSAPVTATMTSIQSTTVTAITYPPDLISLLNGEHHADELCTKYGIGWPKLAQWLRNIGGGTEEGDFGKVSLVYK